LAEIINHVLERFGATTQRFVAGRSQLPRRDQRPDPKAVPKVKFRPSTYFDPQVLTDCASRSASLVRSNLLPSKEENGQCGCHQHQRLDEQNRQRL
jgi:hypothetical protein